MKKYIVLLLLALGGIVGVNYNVSALTYQTGVGVGFTFNPRLAITLSSADLIISNLVPGNAADSNTITVTVNTNTAYGYTLNATVGEATNYNTRNLIRSDINDSFSSIAYGSSLASLTTDNTWGYAYKPSGQSSTWTTYSGLPLYSDTNNVATLISTQDAADSDSVEFKIAARASATQLAGEYKNVINFMAVSNPQPVTLEIAYADAGKTKLNGYYKMQDMNTNICDAVDVEDDELQVIDARDNKVYWIAKLKDGHCWMTQNLDLDLGVATLTHNSTTLYHDDTDLGYGNSENQSWTPDKATYSTGTTTWDSTSTGYTIQQSYDPGDKIWDGTPSNQGTTLDDMNQGTDAHYHIGNYYNWGAAVAMNNTSSYTTNNASVDQSICPAGWTLPKAGSNTAVGSFRYMLTKYGWYYDQMSNPTIWDSPLYFAFVGTWAGYSLGDISLIGNYWSSTISSASASYAVHSDPNTTVTFNEGSYRRVGYSVRCMSR